MWKSWVNFGIGVWVLIFGFFAPTALWKINLIVAGALAIVFGLWGALSRSKGQIKWAFKKNPEGDVSPSG